MTTGLNSSLEVVCASGTVDLAGEVVAPKGLIAGEEDAEFGKASLAGDQGGRHPAWRLH